MGQRVQVLVIKETKNGARRVSFHHHQWGFGRVMYLAAMDMLMQMYNRPYNSNFFMEPAKFPTSPRISDETQYVPRSVLEAVDPDNFLSMAEVFTYGDNNNGGMVIYIKQETDYDKNDDIFRVGFLLGEEDCNAGEEEFSRWLSPEEYAKRNGGSEYSDNDFVKMFKDFCDYFGITTFPDNSRDEADNARALKDIVERRRQKWQELKDAGKDTDDDTAYGYEGVPTLIRHKYEEDGEKKERYLLIRNDYPYGAGPLTKPDQFGNTSFTHSVNFKTTDDGDAVDGHIKAGECGNYEVVAIEDNAVETFNAILKVEKLKFIGHP